MTGSPFNNPWNYGEDPDPGSFKPRRDVFVNSGPPLSYKKALAALPHVSFHYTRDETGETWEYDQCVPITDPPLSFLQYWKFRFWIVLVVALLMVSAKYLDGWWHFAAVLPLSTAMWMLIDAVANQKKGRK